MRPWHIHKNWLICSGAVFTIVVLAIALDPTYVLKGWLRGESFFRGRPTAYWSNSIRHGGHEFNSAFGLVIGGTRERDGIPVLVELLEDANDEVRFAACNGLSINGPSAKQAIPRLLRMLDQSNVFYRRNASIALASILTMADIDVAMPAMIRGVQDSDYLVNYHCAVALGRFGPSAEEAVPALLALEKSNNATKDVFGYTIRNTAAWALGEIRGVQKKEHEHKG